MKVNKLYSFLTIVLVIFFVLTSLLVGCNKDYINSGNLKIKPIDCNTIDVYYSYNNVGVARIIMYPSGNIVATLGSDSGSGVYRNSELSPNMEYNFSLVDYKIGSGASLLATATGRTSSY